MKPVKENPYFTQGPIGAHNYSLMYMVQHLKSLKTF